MGYIPKSDLKALATAHRLIRFHAIPLLYRKVTIHTVQAGAYEKAKGLVETPYILKWINAFVFSAPLDSPFTRNTEIFNNFVNSFSKMPNLRELKLVRIRLNLHAEMEILDTPLTSFACDQCLFTGEQLTPALARQSSVTTLQFSLKDDAEFPDSLPTFLNNFPNVETLDIDTPLPYREYTRLPKFPSLTSLIIRRPIALCTFRIILRQSPLLARLNCMQRQWGVNDGTAIKIPRLQCIEAPLTTVIQLLESPVLRSIVLLTRKGYRHNQCEFINHLLSAIKRGPGQQITSLDVTVFFHTQEQAREFLVNLSDAVPNLSRFTLRVDPFIGKAILDSPPYNGNARLPKLESLTVSIVLSGRQYYQPQVIPEHIVESFARVFLEPLVQPICPSLQVVRVLPWCESLSKTVLEGEGTMWKFERRD